MGQHPLKPKLTNFDPAKQKKNLNSTPLEKRPILDSFEPSGQIGENFDYMVLKQNWPFLTFAKQKKI